MYPHNSTGTGFENQSIFRNYHKKLAQGKEPSLQQYRFSPYAESRLLSAALCSVMDSVDKAGMTEVVRSGITHLAD